MELQPDFERLADCFAGASQELRKLPNVPVINEGQNILAAISTMQEQMVEQYQSLKTEIGGLKTQIGGVERRLDSLEGRFDRLEARFDGLQLRLNAESQNQMARLFNSHVTGLTHDFSPVRDTQNLVPAGYPSNGSALASMTTAELGLLLGAYEVQPQRTVEARRRQLRQFIGVVYQV